MTAQNDQIFRHRGRGGGVVAAGGELANVIGEIHFAVVAKAFAALAGIGIQRNQAGIGGGQIQPARAHYVRGANHLRSVTFIGC